MSLIKIYVIMICFCFSVKIKAQKSIINIDAVKNWEEVSLAGLTSDGKYGYYETKTGRRKEIHAKNLDGSWEINLPGGKNPIVSGNDKYLIFEVGLDSIAFFEFSKKKVVHYYNGKSLTWVGIGKFQQVSWIEKTHNRQSDNLIGWSPGRGITTLCENLFSRFCDEASNTMLLVSLDNSKYRLISLNAVNGVQHALWQNTQMPFGFTINQSGSRIAFFVDNGSKKYNAEKICIVGKDNLITEIDSNTIGNRNNGGWMSFSGSGDVLFFSISKAVVPDPRRDKGVAVDVWSYRDEVLQSKQLLVANEPVQNLMGYIFDKKQIINFSKKKDEKLDRTSIGNKNDMVIVFKGLQKPDDIQLEEGEQPKCAIILKNLRKNTSDTVARSGYFSQVSFSPEGKYIVYFDRFGRRYYTYDVTTRKTFDISSQFPDSEIFVQRNKESYPITLPEGESGWFEDDRFVFIYDKFDIWQVDPSGISLPVCLTDNYGKNNNCELKFFKADNEKKRDYKVGDLVWIYGINRNNYKEGYTKINIGVKNKININFEPFHYFWIKRYDDKFLVTRSSDKMPVNCYLSENLKDFVPISDCQPQKLWNWYTKELVNYQLHDGSWNKGILYKPENFDPGKKYPVVFHFYEMLSDQFYTLHSPAMATGAINPAWMCSQGYLVFQPDIPSKFGEPGESAYDAVISAVNYLAKYNWVDSTKMGLSGSSHGAYSINYILTKTQRFAAAVPAFGMVDMISGYNALRFGASRQWEAETNQERMGATLWENPDVYVRNSPIFKADKVTTPVLILHNKNDGGVPWTQGVEWYLALRRTGKKVWMLQYDDEEHGLDKERNVIDYTTRLEQFFGYYLKNDFPPKWLVDGIPATMKGIDDGLELKTTNKKP